MASSRKTGTTPITTLSDLQGTGPMGKALGSKSSDETPEKQNEQEKPQIDKKAQRSMNKEHNVNLQGSTIEMDAENTAQGRMMTKSAICVAGNVVKSLIAREITTSGKLTFV
ncbi:uncharacterized protein PG986_011237 [Apiospora aurea]|uniref:Uncharacterized protein n=1 Tax=Apiospora aurea TaxID=335848 RepID=A0ABR1Q501_9PEZI